MRTFAVFAFMILLMKSALGQDHNFAMQLSDAESRCQKAIDDAEAIKTKAEISALTDLLATLEGIKAKESNRFKVLELEVRVQDVRERLGILTGKKLTLRVTGNKAWQKFGTVIKGQHLYITAAGKWMDNIHDDSTRWGPDGRRGDGRWRLVAQIDGNDAFTVGSKQEIIVAKSGTMEFGMADSTHKDGGGVLEVTVVLVN
jgi:hypothetical protein